MLPRASCSLLHFSSGYGAIVPSSPPACLRSLVDPAALGPPRSLARSPSASSRWCNCSDANGSESIEKMSEIGPGSLQQETCVGGAQQLSVGLAERVLRRGGRILLGHRVVHISHGKTRAKSTPAAAAAGSTASAGGDDMGSVSLALEHRTASKPVLLTCANGLTIAADHVLIAAPAPVASAYISFAPALSPERSALMRGATMGSIIKAIIIYPRAFWRRDGFSGEVVCDTASHPDGGPCFNLFDGCGLVGSSAGGGSLGLRVATSHVGPAVSGSAARSRQRSKAALGPISAAEAAAADVTAAAAAASAGGSSGGFAFLLPAEARSAAPTAHWVAPAVAAWVGAGRPLASAPAIEFVNGPHPVSGAPARFVPALVAFVNGERAHAWSSARVSADARREAILRQIGSWFGAAEDAAAPLEYVEHDWGTYPHTRGCPVASYGAGVLEAYGVARPLSQPEWPDNAAPSAAGGADGAAHSSRYGAVDDAAANSSPGSSKRSPAIHRLHWAGTETSTVSTGFIDGAIRSGWRAAAEIVKDIAAEAAAAPSRTAAAAIDFEFVHAPVPAERLGTAAAAAAEGSGASAGAGAMPIAAGTTSPSASPSGSASAARSPHEKASAASAAAIDIAAAADESSASALRAPLLDSADGADAAATV